MRWGQSYKKRRVRFDNSCNRFLHLGFVSSEVATTPALFIICLKCESRQSRESSRYRMLRHSPSMNLRFVLVCRTGFQHTRTLLITNVRSRLLQLNECVVWGLCAARLRDSSLGFLNVPDGKKCANNVCRNASSQPLLWTRWMQTFLRDGPRRLDLIHFNTKHSMYTMAVLFTCGMPA